MTPDHPRPGRCEHCQSVRVVQRHRGRLVCGECHEANEAKEFAQFHEAHGITHWPRNDPAYRKQMCRTTGYLFWEAGVAVRQFKAACVEAINHKPT